MLGVGSVSTLMSDSASSSRVVFWSHPNTGLQERKSPGSGSGPRGSGEAARPRTPAAGIRTEIVAAHRARKRVCHQRPRPRKEQTSLLTGTAAVSVSSGKLIADMTGRWPPRRTRLRGGAQPTAAQGGAARRLAAADRRGRGLRQDRGAHPPHRLPAGRARRGRRAGPGHHLHQQGRRGDARARGPPDRPPGPVHVGVDVPLHVRPDSAQSGLPAARPQLELLDLRLRRLAAPADDDRQGHGPRHQAVLAATAGERHLQPEERAHRSRQGHVRGVRGRRRPRPHRRRGVRRIPAQASGGQRARLRRPHRRDGRGVAGVPTDRPVLPAAVPAHPGRRVPGHQPRAVHAGARTRRPRSA